MNEPQVGSLSGQTAGVILGNKLAYSRKEGAHRLSISVRQLDYLIDAGEIKVIRSGRRVLIPETSLRQFLRHDCTVCGRSKCLTFCTRCVVNTSRYRTR
jgi:excisionase family DNA binding protein